LELRSVTKVHGDGPSAVRALDQVDLVLETGSLVAVMGPSGSGKSTLLTIAGALEEPTAGEVWVAGESLAGWSANQRACLRRRNIGYVFQDYNLLAGLTAVENVAMPLELDGTSVRPARSSALSALEQLGMADKADRFPDDLSGGERQRVAIARAMVGERRLLLADEPTGSLDSRNGQEVMRLLRESCRSGMAGLVVTHDAELALYADRVVHLLDGKISEQTVHPAGHVTSNDSETAGG
jgi:putative ABC transport system ATP-binding protein